MTAAPPQRAEAARRRDDRRSGVGFPRLLWVPAAAAFALIALPVLGLAVRADWPRMPELLLSESAMDALRLSLLTAGISTVLCIVFGGPLAVVLARGRLRGLPVLRSVVLLPLVLPPVVGGLALLFLLGRTGLLGRGLDLWFGVTIPFTTTAVVLAQTFVALPFLVVSLEGALRVAGQRYEAVAATLGASPALAFRRVTVPLVLPGLLSGAVLAFARSMGEFGATIAFAGSLQGTTRTLPLLVYLERESDVDAAVALSLLLVVVAVLVIGVARPRSSGLGAGEQG
jgi:molybdate transport system permease protein